MSDAPSTLQVIANQLALAVEPLQRGVADLDSFKTLMRKLGWGVETLPPQYAALASAANAAIQAVEALTPDSGIDQILAAINKTAAVYRAIRGLTGAPAGVDAAAFLEDIGESLFELLLAEYLSISVPTVANALELAGVIVHEDHPAQLGRPAYVRTRIRYDLIPRALSDPESIPELVFGWGTPGFDFPRLARVLYDLLRALTFPANLSVPEPARALGYQTAPTEQQTKNIDTTLQIPIFELPLPDGPVEGGIEILELPAQAGKLPGIIIQPYAPKQFVRAIPITPDITLTLRAGADATSTFGVLLRPGGDISVIYPFAPGTALPPVGVGIGFAYAPAQPLFIFGESGKTRLQLAGATLGFDLDYVNSQIELKLSAQLAQLALILSAADVDSFLRSLVGGSDLTVAIPFQLAWSNRTGLNFVTGAGLAFTSYPHLNLGIARIDRFDLGFVAKISNSGPPNAQLSGAISLSAAIGPVAFSVDSIGTQLVLNFTDGNAGPFDIDFGFKPPTGLGIVVSAGIVTGGGFISFDPANSRYAGALQLQIGDISVKAIGILETKLPGGASGYSFLILIDATFAPIELGFGFTLNGVGGLAGLNRSVAVDVIRAGLRNHTLDSVLFPADPIRNAPQIISNLETIIPPTPGRHVFGPMALIGWGVPALIEAEIGLLLELPDPVRLILLGQISAALPTKQTATVSIHLDLLGVLDFDQKLLSLDGSLYDSRIAGYPLSGDMAMRLNWGSQPNFTLAVGGLNPHFQPPPNFPTLQPITIALGEGDNPRITAKAYMALTSNTVQFGAKAELYAEAAGFNVYGWVGFDVLVIFSPFSFEADLDAGVALRHGSTNIASVHLSGKLTGPSPWHAVGEASLSLFFFDISVGFDATFGESRTIEAPSLDPWPQLQQALADARNWSAVLPPAAVRVVSTRSPAAGVNTTLVDPVGDISVKQTVTPLNRKITKFGQGAPQTHDEFDLTNVTVGTASGTPWTPVSDYFPPAQFEDMKDDEKLARPSFELMDAGATVAANALTSGPSVGVDVTYQTFIVDSPWQRRHAPVYGLTLNLMTAFLTSSPAALGGIRSAGLGRFNSGKPPQITLTEQDEFVIASTADLTARADVGFSGMSKGSAQAALRAYLNQHPEESGQLQVVARFEVAA